MYETYMLQCPKHGKGLLKKLILIGLGESCILPGDWLKNLPYDNFDLYTNVARQIFVPVPAIHRPSGTGTRF
jgi:hypothetical protein